MEKLSQIPIIQAKIKVAPRAAILALHKLIFEYDGDRNNRQRLREFKGFSFADDSAEYRAKMDYACGLSIGDLASICNILGIDYTGNKEQLRERIIRGLMDLNSLNTPETDDDDDDDEQHEEVANPLN